MAEVKLSFEALKNDVSATQHCISELLPMVGPVHASSWRFPEISSSEVNTKKLLDKIAFTEDEEKFVTTRTLLMELAIDRLVFLLQCTFKLLESSGGTQSASIPLTLGSSVRKFTKQVLRVNRNIAVYKQQITDYNKQLDKKSETIIKFQNNVSVLEKDNTMLREALSNAVSKAEEAQQIQVVVEEKPQLEYIPAADCKPPVESIAVQTTETAFALCATCVSMQKCLLSCSALTSQLCTSLSVNSAVAEKDFPSQMEETGRIDHSLWLALSQQDTKLVLKAVTKLQEQCSNLKSDLSSKERNVKSLDFKLNEVKKDFSEYMSNFEATKEQHKDNMANLCSEYESKFEQLRQQNSKLLKDFDNTEALVNEYRIKEAHFKREIDTARKSQNEFEVKLSVATNEVTELKKRCQGLQEGIRAMTDELQLMKSEIQEKVIALKKAETQNRTLSMRDKAMQGKQLALLSKLEQFGQECNTLRADLGTALHDREGMVLMLTDLEQKCGQLQQQLIIEEQRTNESFMTQKSLQLTVEALGNQLEDIKVDLEQEKEKCLLLMDYPSLNGADSNYMEYLNSLEYFEMQNHLSANMIRIMLLEDQNKDLRKMSVQDSSKGEANFKLKGPIPLWKDDLLKKMKQEYKSLKKNKQNRPPRSRSSNRDDVVVTDMEKSSPNSQTEVSPVAGENGPRSRSSSGRTRGSIGRLMMALNESKLIAPPNSFVTLHDHD